MSSLKGKLKTAYKQASTLEGIPKVVLQIGFGFAIGAILDMIVHALYSAFIAEGWEKVAGSRSPVPFYYYRYPPEEYDWASTLAWDDLFLFILTFLVLLSKKVWFTVGFFFGWYVSSNEELYARLIGPFLPPEEGA